MTLRDPKSIGMNEPDFLVEAIPNPLHGAKTRAAQNAWIAPVFPFLISLFAGVLCYRAAGVSLGMFLGGLLLAGLVTAPLVAAEQIWLGRALAIVAIIHGIAMVWLYAAMQADLDLSLWAAGYVTLAVLVVFIGGIAILLTRIVRAGVTGAGAIATLLALAWLMWPIWLSPALHGSRGETIARWLVPAHPIYALNSVLGPKLGYWAEQGIAYNLTNLGDDISYSLPSGILWCALFHAAVGGGCMAIAWLAERRAHFRTSPDTGMTAPR